MGHPMPFGWIRLVARDGARCHARPFAFCERAEDFSDVLGIVGAFEPSWQRWDCVRHGGTEERVLGIV